MSLHHRLRTAAGSPSDPYWSNTSLLLLGNGTNGGQNNTFIDSSSNNFTITRNGNVTQGSFSPFTIATGSEYSTGTNGGSGYFDGTGDYLEVADANALDLQSGDFTIEMWVYRTNSGVGQQLITNYGSTTTGYGLFINASNKLVANLSGDVADITGTTDVPVNQWCHVALSGTPSSSVKMFLNGTQEGSTYTGTTSLDSSYKTTIGAFWWYFNSQIYDPFQGYISNVRILKGTKLYTSSFTPPTAPLTSITNTSLLLNFVNGSIIDSTGKNDLETVGDAQISTATKKYGTGSLKFDGTGDYLVAPDNAIYSFGTGDFTIECWVYITTTGRVNGIWGNGPNSSGSFALYILSSNKIEAAFNTGATTTGSTALSANTWYHIAVTRSGSTLRIFVDGVVDVTNNSAGSNNTTSKCTVGNSWTNNTDSFAGYIDDFRITKGVARWTANYTPPTRQLPAR